FHRQIDAVNLLHRLIKEFDLRPEFCVFGITSSGIGDPAAVNPSDTATNGTEIPPGAHNLRVRRALKHLTQNLPTFAIFDKGTNDNEISCVWVDNGRFYGMGHI